MRLKQNPTVTPGARRFVLISACALLALATCASALTLRIKVISPFAAVTNTAMSSGEPVQIPSDKAAEHVIKKVTPKYPQDAKKARIQGTVTLKAVIGKDGEIEHLSVISGSAPLQQSALDAVRQWVYRPFVLNGKPTAVETTINVIYSLAK